MSLIHLKDANDPISRFLNIGCNSLTTNSLINNGNLTVNGTINATGNIITAANMTASGTGQFTGGLIGTGNVNCAAVIASGNVTSAGIISGAVTCTSVSCTGNVGCASLTINGRNAPNLLNKEVIGFQNLFNQAFVTRDYATWIYPGSVARGTISSIQVPYSWFGSYTLILTIVDVTNTTTIASYNAVPPGNYGVLNLTLANIPVGQAQFVLRVATGSGDLQNGCIGPLQINYANF